jgi:hypothetical protein
MLTPGRCGRCCCLFAVVVSCCLVVVVVGWCFFFFFFCFFLLSHTKSRAAEQQQNSRTTAEVWVKMSESWTCPVEGLLPCRCLPTVACFAQPEGWRFCVPAGGTNRARAIQSHLDLHTAHDDQAAQLLAAVARIKRVDAGFACDCGKNERQLSKALNHKCLSSTSSSGSAGYGAIAASRAAQAAQSQKRRRSLVHLHPMVNSLREQPAPQASSKPPLPEDQICADLGRQFAERRAAASRLHAVGLTSFCNGARLSSPQLSSSLRVGDFFRYPRTANSYACLWASPSGGNMWVVRFDPFPKNDSGCKIHLGCGGCWRSQFPLQPIEIPASQCNLQAVSLLPRVADPGRTGLRLSTRCFMLARHTHSVGFPPRSNIVQDFVEDMLSQLIAGGEQDLPAPNVQKIFADVATVELAFLAAPSNCPACVAAPACDEPPCRIRLCGKRVAGKFVSSLGVRICIAQVYECVVHSSRWNLPAGRHTQGATLVGDVLGKHIVGGCFWAPVWRLYQDTESFVAVERHVRDITEASIRNAVSQHRLRDSLALEDQRLLLGILLQHCMDVPSRYTLKRWLHQYVSVLVWFLMFNQLVIKQYQKGL